MTINNNQTITERIQEYLHQVEVRMKQPCSQKAEVLQNIEVHIREALQRKSGGQPTMADLEAVLAEMDAPESYGDVGQPLQAKPRSRRGIVTAAVIAATILVCILVWLAMISGWLPAITNTNNQTITTANKSLVSSSKLDDRKAVPESTTIGTVKELVKQASTVRHKLQVWRVFPKYVVSGRYTLEVQHAAAGKRGAFYLIAWIDSNGDDIPDKEITRSRELSGREVGDWSEWSFTLRKEPKALYVGSAWKDSETRVYYKRSGPAPDGYVGLGHKVLYSHGSDGPPTASVGPRYTNIKLLVPTKK